MSHQLIKSCYGGLLQILFGSLSSQNSVAHTLSIATSEKSVHSNTALTALHDTREQAGKHTELGETNLQS